MLSRRNRSPERDKQLALYLRYQSTHDRAFHKSLSDLLKRRAEKHKAEIGFVSQQAKLSRERERAELAQNRAQQQAAAEKRREELHRWKVLRTQAEIDHRILLNMNRATPEHPIAFGPQHIRDAEKAA